MTSIRAAHGVRWVVGRVSLTVLDAAGTSTRLSYPEAAIWDLISRGRTPAEAAARLVSIASVETHAAEDAVRRAIEDWLASGLIVRV